MSIQPFLYGKYVILDRIAVGGMAEVFRAQTFGVHGFQRFLVIKRILPHLSKDEEFVDMFIDEAKIAVDLPMPTSVKLPILEKLTTTILLQWSTSTARIYVQSLKNVMRAKVH